LRNVNRRGRRGGGGRKERNRREWKLKRFEDEGNG